MNKERTSARSLGTRRHRFRSRLRRDGCTPQGEIWRGQTSTLRQCHWFSGHALPPESRGRLAWQIPERHHQQIVHKHASFLNALHTNLPVSKEFQSHFPSSCRHARTTDMPALSSMVLKAQKFHENAGKPTVLASVPHTWFFKSNSIPQFVFASVQANGPLPKGQWESTRLQSLLGRALILSALHNMPMRGSRAISNH